MHKNYITIQINPQITPISPRLPWRNRPQCARASSLSRLHDHTQKHHTQLESCGRVISPSLKPLPDNTQHSQQTNIHAPDRIRTRNPNRRAAADPCLRMRGHRDRFCLPLYRDLRSCNCTSSCHVFVFCVCYCICFLTSSHIFPIIIIEFLIQHTYNFENIYLLLLSSRTHFCFFCLFVCFCFSWKM